MAHLTGFDENVDFPSETTHFSKLLTPGGRPGRPAGDATGFFSRAGAKNPGAWIFGHFEKNHSAAKKYPSAGSPGRQRDGILTFCTGSSRAAKAASVTQRCKLWPLRLFLNENEYN